jgi:hypothetical protein
MSKGFAIEFCTVTFFSDEGDEHNTVDRFRVLVKDEAITAYIAYTGPFGEGWARIIDDEARASRADIRSCSWPAPFRENRVIALAFSGYLNEGGREIVHFDEYTLIKLGTIKREA